MLAINKRYSQNLEGSKLPMLPKNDQDSWCFKLLYFATCLHRAGSLKKPYYQTDCVGMAEGDAIVYKKGGATANVNFVFSSNSCRAQ